MKLKEIKMKKGKKGKKDEGELLPEDWEPQTSIGPNTPPKPPRKKVTVFVM